MKGAERVAFLVRVMLSFFLLEVALPFAAEGVGDEESGVEVDVVSCEGGEKLIGVESALVGVGVVVVEVETALISSPFLCLFLLLEGRMESTTILLVLAEGRDGVAEGEEEEEVQLSASPASAGVRLSKGLWRDVSEDKRVVEGDRRGEDARVVGELDAGAKKEVREDWVAEEDRPRREPCLSLLRRRED